MAELFGRVYSLIIGNPSRLGEPPITIGEAFITGENFQNAVVPEVIESEFREFTDLQIKAVLPQTKSRPGSGDKAYIEIYNLSPENEEFVKNAQLMFFNAGYRQDVELPALFVGDIQDVITEDKGKDTITKILCGQRIRAGRNARISKTYPAGESFNDILNDLINFATANNFSVRATLPSGTSAVNLNNIQNTNNIGVNLNSTLVDDEISFINRGLPVEGYILDVIEQVCSMINYRSYMVLDRLIIEPAQDDVPIRREVIRINNSNIQETIRSKSKTKFDNTNDSKTKEIFVKVFLDGRITSDKRLEITEGEFIGTYNILKVEHVLNLEGKDWTTEVTARSI